MSDPKLISRSGTETLSSVVDCSGVTVIRKFTWNEHAKANAERCAKAWGEPLEWFFEDDEDPIATARDLGTREFGHSAVVGFLLHLGRYGSWDIHDYPDAAALSADGLFDYALAELDELTEEAKAKLRGAIALAFSGDFDQMRRDIDQAFAGLGWKRLV